MDNRPIGIFDSGVGGLTVWKEVAALLPDEEIHYFADTAHCPYGGRPQDEIVVLACSVVDYLLVKGCKCLITASNTITSAAIGQLRQLYNIPFVGIEPAVKPAARQTKTGHIGVLATAFTLQSDRYERLLESHAGNVQIHYQAGKGLVEITERGEEETPATEALLRKYLQGMIAAGIDQLILGCTHYPFLLEPIRRIVGSGVTIHNPADAVSRRTEDLLVQMGLQSAPHPERSYIFYTNGAAEILLKKVAALRPDLRFQGKSEWGSVVECRFIGAPSSASGR